VTENTNGNNSESEQAADAQKPPTALNDLVARFGDKVKPEPPFRGELAARVAPEDLIPALTFLRKGRKPAFEMLIDICGADYPEREKRFDVVYHLLSMSNTERIRIKTSVAEGEELPTATGLWNAANWQEREVFDMFGIPFAGHPNLKRILMWEGFDGHPLRKDFPLKGNAPQEERYAEKDKRRTKDMKQYCWEGYCTDL